MSSLGVSSQAATAPKAINSNPARKRKSIAVPTIYHPRYGLDSADGRAGFPAQARANARLAAARVAGCVMKDDARFQAAIAAFDRENAQDPNQELDQGQLQPRELLQAVRYTQWLGRLRPDAPEAVWLAVRCQHIRRWERPRSDFPPGRTGYLKWRKELAQFHADTAGRILTEVGYDELLRGQVRVLNLKHELKHNVDTQTIEDVLCLSFIAHELAAFSEKHPREKLIDILQKTWRKMSESARALALTLTLPEPLPALVTQALASEGSVASGEPAASG